LAGDSQSTTQLKLTAFSGGPCEQGDALVLAVMRRWVSAVDPLHGRAAQPAHEVEVVGREVHDHADVADAVGERADALGGDEEDLAEVASLRLLAAQQRGVEALGRARPRRGSPRPAGVDERAPFGRGGGELLDEDVTPSAASVLTAATRSRSVPRRWRSPAPGAQQVVDVGEQQRLVAAARREAVAAGIDGAGEGDAAMPAAAARGGRSSRAQHGRAARVESGSTRRH
jgi:hypothetical protein